MKKIFIFLASVCISLSATAQDEAPTKQHSVATNSFWNNWYAQAGVSWTAFYSSEERAMTGKSSYSYNPLKSFRGTPGLALSLGKWFTPGIGLRTKIQGVWGRSVVSEDRSENFNNYWTLQEQATLSLSNLLLGYDEARKWDAGVFGGVGMQRNCTYNVNSMTYSLGITGTWKVKGNTSLYVEAGMLVGESHSNGYNLTYHNKYNRDRHFYLEAGISYNIGKSGFRKTVDTSALEALHQAQIDALNAQISELQEENMRLSNGNSTEDDDF